MNSATAYIGIGSNLANPQQQVLCAVAALRALPSSHLKALSPWYGSRPVGGPANQPDYINGVACLETQLTPHQLLDALQSIEQQQQRERSVRWGARTLDLDLLLYDQRCIHDERLTVPHPRLQERTFVLAPLADLAPQLVLPNRCSVASLLAALPSDGLWPLPIDDNTP
ncbi:MAG: 2-amino-4-hydroxy-6-hydroxymethyldihydropteridine diphosphokinase [Pseudomonadales bacterium]|nr:2-amino-4-hydroxy-6-hydroxymethyldihydropteridine diphosphokinase [Pseudomonadales bacterium]